MPETLEQAMARHEKIKREDGVDELIQHYYWTTFEIFVPLEKIRNGPDLLLTLLSAKINAQFAAISIPPAPVAIENPNASRKA